MSDDRLAALERAWRQTGADDDEAALLRERLRRGELPERRASLAAALDHAGARRALGEAAPARVTSAEGCSRLLPRLDPEEAVRVAIAAARLAVARSPESLEYATVRRDLRTAEAWAVRPDAAPIVPTEEEVGGLPATFGGPSCTVGRDTFAWLAAAHAAGVARATEYDERLFELERALSTSCYALFGASFPLRESSTLFASQSSKEAIVSPERLAGLLDAIRAEVAPWALGHGDPVADRLAPGLNGSATPGKVGPEKGETT